MLLAVIDLIFMPFFFLLLQSMTVAEIVLFTFPSSSRIVMHMLQHFQLFR